MSNPSDIDIKDPDKRPHYFTGQFLQEQDFTAEQAYHIDRQRRHNRQFHTPGIADGLTVEVKQDQATKQVSATVAPGTAVDSDGRQIVLLSSQSVPFKAPDGAVKDVLVVISYFSQQTDVATVGKQEPTRFHERPLVEAYPADKAPSEASYIRLAKVTFDAQGNITSLSDKDSVRRKAGVNIGDTVSVRELRVSRKEDSQDKWPLLSSGATGRADLTGALRVTGETTAEGNLNVSGSLKVGGNDYRSGWVRLPFLPKRYVPLPPNPVPAEFTPRLCHANCTGPAAGSIEIPIPAGVTRISRLRIAGSQNEGGIAISLYRVNAISGNATSTQLLSQSIAATRSGFNVTYIVSGDANLDAENQALALLVEAAGAADIWFIGAEFGK